MRTKDHLGNHFISQKEMCKAYGVSVNVFLANRKAGLTLKECLKPKRSATKSIAQSRQKATKSIAQFKQKLAQRCKVTTKHKRKVVKKSRWTVTDFQGNTYASINKMCEAYGIPGSLYNQRVRVLGWDKKVALLTPAKERGKKISVKGKEYSSISAAARAYGKTYKQVDHRISDGWSLEEAILTPMLERATAT